MPQVSVFGEGTNIIAYGSITNWEDVTLLAGAYMQLGSVTYNFTNLSVGPGGSLILVDLSISILFIFNLFSEWNYSHSNK
jgi:hypothetical protein